MQSIDILQNKPQTITATQYLCGRCVIESKSKRLNNKYKFTEQMIIHGIFGGEIGDNAFWY